MLKKFFFWLGIIAALAIVGNLYTKRDPHQPGIINPSKLPTRLPGVEVK